MFRNQNARRKKTKQGNMPTIHSGGLHHRRGLKKLALLLLVASNPDPTEATRLGYVRRTKLRPISSIRPNVSNGEAEANILLLDSWSSISDTHSNNPLPTTSELGDLAEYFQQAIRCTNRNEQEEDIHVGNLLSACERLEKIMRNIGFSQGANDIKGNVGKIRPLYDHAPVDQRDSMSSLLRYELESGMHKDKSGGKQLKDPSATMGFLWLGRALHYEYDMFNNMLDKNEEPYEAARRAYDEHLKQFHSWPAQKVCHAAMKTLKSMRCNTVLAQLGGFSEETFGNKENQATRRVLRQMMDSWKPMLSKWSEVFSDFELEHI
jgi:hypothetical protein